MSRILAEARLAMRRLGRTPGFTLVALVTLVLGIGANTAIYSVVHAVLLRPLPFRDPQDLYLVWTRHPSTDRYPFQLPEFCDYRDQNRTLEGFAGFATWAGSLQGDGASAERLQGLRVSGNFFDLLGAPAVLGRTLKAEDDEPGHEKVAVLTHGLWLRRFGGDPKVVGRALALNGEAFMVVGVLGPDFLFPVRTTEIAIPLAPDSDPWRLNRRSTNFIRGLARARPGVSASQVVADLEAIGTRLKREFPESYAIKQGVLVAGYGDELTRSVRPVLLLLQGSVALLLLIASANVANLVLVRATDRQGEMAIRQALGAPRSSLVWHLLAESAVLALGGAAGALLLARWSVPALVALSPAAMPRAQQIGISLPVMLFTLATAVLVSLVAAYVPAARLTRLDPRAHLVGAGRGGARGPERARAQGLMVATQVALMVVLLAGAGLLFRSFRQVMRVDPGFDPGVLTVRLSLPRKDYGELARMSAFYRQLDLRVRALPGVQAVAAVNQVPLNGAIASAEYKVADGPEVSDDRLPTALYRVATPEFFRAMDIPILAGRAFEEGDREGSAPVAIIGATLARQAFPGRDAVGRDLLVRDTPKGFRPLRIVGVAGDVRHGGLEVASPEPHVYVAYHQTPRDLMVFLNTNQFLVVRSAGNPLALGESVRRALTGVDPSVAAADIRLSGWYVDSAAGARRFGVELVGLFAAVAVALAAIGIYGVVSYTVSRRAREIGIRRALGADRREIIALVLGEGLRRTLFGAAVGAAAVLAAGHWLQALLFRVPSADPVTFAAVLLLPVLVTVGACLSPAWRAARVDPAVALRVD